MKKVVIGLFVFVFTISLSAQSVQNIEQPNRYKVYQNEISLSASAAVTENASVPAQILAAKSNVQIENLGGDSRLGWTRSNSQIANLGDELDSRLGWTRSNSQIANLGDELDSRLGWTR